MFRRIFSLIKILIILAFLGTALVVLLGIWYAKDLPDPEKVLSKGFAESTKIYDRTGNTLLYQVGQERRTVIKLAELPPHVRWATLVAEDSDFYTHPGIDVPGIIRAAIRDVQTRSLEQGGSTITQQLVKNALLSPEKTFSRKFREIVLAIWLETKYSKDEILSFYLNQIPYGQNAFGIEQASRTYFGKSARDITVPEAAILASLPLRPSYLSPYGEHKDELLARKDFLIGRMVQEGYITGSQAVDARNEEIVFS
jgi:penicillin-binding protein 1A